MKSSTTRRIINIEKHLLERSYPGGWFIEQCHHWQVDIDRIFDNIKRMYPHRRELQERLLYHAELIRDMSPDIEIIDIFLNQCDMNLEEYKEFFVYWYAVVTADD